MQGFQTTEPEPLCFIDFLNITYIHKTFDGRDSMLRLLTSVIYVQVLVAEQPMDYVYWRVFQLLLLVSNWVENQQLFVGGKCDLASQVGYTRNKKKCYKQWLVECDC